MSKLSDYVELVYGKDSELVSRYSILKQRKRQASMKLGLSKAESKRFEELRDKRVVSAICRFLRKQDERLWSLIVTNEEVFEEYEREVLTTVTSERGDKDKLQALEVKAKLMAEMNKIHNRLRGYYNELAGGDEAVAEAARVSRKMTPEMLSFAEEEE